MCSTKFGVCVWTRLELKARLSEGSEFLKHVWAHLVVIGRRKKGPCVLGTGSKSLTQPSVTQPSTVQNQPTRGKKKKKTQQQDCSPSPLPTYPDSWPILIIPQQSPWQRFFYINTVQSLPFLPLQYKKVGAAMSQVDPELHYFWRQLLCLG